MKTKIKFYILITLICVLWVASILAIFIFKLLIPFMICLALAVSVVIYCYIRVSELPEDITNDTDYSNHNVNCNEE